MNRATWRHTHDAEIFKYLTTTSGFDSEKLKLTNLEIDKAKTYCNRFGYIYIFFFRDVPSWVFGSKKFVLKDSKA